MSNLNALNIAQLKKAVSLRERIDSLQTKLAKVLGDSPRSAGRPRGVMSAAGRARIVAAQKARWAKIKGGAAPAKKGKRKMSATGRAAIAAAQKARWAKVKPAGN